MLLNKSESNKHEKGENIFFYLSEIFQEFSKKLNSIIFPMIELSGETYKKIFTDINSILNSYPTYNDYIQLVEEFSQGNESSNLYNKVIKIHFQAKKDGPIQKANSNYFLLVNKFVENMETSQKLNPKLKHILINLPAVEKLRDYIGEEIVSPKERYEILKDFLNFLPYIYNSAKVNILWNVIIFLLGKSSFSKSQDQNIYGKKYLKKVKEII